MVGDESVRCSLFCCYQKFLFCFLSLKLGYGFDKPDSMSDAKLKKQMEFHIAARQGPVSGLSHKWDYETGWFSRSLLN